MTLKAGTTGSFKCWQGVLRDETGRVVWTCEHKHGNRDMSGRFGISARRCAENELHRLRCEAA